VRVTVLTESELRDCVGLDLEAVDLVAEAFSALSRGDAVMPPILRLDIEDHNGEVDVKTAYVRGFDSFAIKISPGFFDNPKLGLPSLNGLMNLFSAKTGLLEAVLLDNGYLTDLRTAAAGAVAARALAREDARTAGVIGTGVQARLQMKALKLVRDVRRLLVWGRDADKASAYADEMAGDLGIDCAVAATAEALVRESDIVVTTTPSRSPLIQAAWLHSGLHITAMGSDAEHKNEIQAEALARADRFICDSKAQSLRLGELHHAVEAGVLAQDAPVIELGAVTSGATRGREAPSEVTICDLTGTGVQDTAIALHAFRKASAKGYGRVIET